MEAVYPRAASALARGRRLRRAAATDQRLRTRTTPVTFAEIKEVDEVEGEVEGAGAGGGSEASLERERRRRPDLLEDRLGRQFAEFRRRRPALRELSPPPPAAPAPAALTAAPAAPPAHT